MTTAACDLDIVLVSHNTRDELGACLRSLAAAPPAQLGRIWVVDNASTDGSADMLQADWPEVRTVALDRNVGFAAANNIALRESDAALVLLLNSDTEAPPTSIDRLVDRLIDTGATAAGPLLVDRAGRPEVSFGPMLSPATELFQRLRVRLAASERRLARRYVARLVGRERWVDWVSGACLLVRRREAMAAGLLDERYFMYEEDVDFCAALRGRGGRVLFTPQARIVHLRGQSVGRTTGGAKALYDRSHLAFYQKHAPRWAPALRAWLAVRGRSIR